MTTRIHKSTPRAVAYSRGPAALLLPHGQALLSLRLLLPLGS